MLSCAEEAWLYKKESWVYSGAHNPKGRSIELVIPPVVEWHLQENSIYGMPSWLVKPGLQC